MSLDLHRLLVAHGGAIATHELHSAGLSKDDIAREVRRGQLIRARQGWYVGPGIHPDLVRAVRVGGRLSCRSALDLHGLWVVTDQKLHVIVDGNDCQLRSPSSRHRRLGTSDPVTIHWRDSRDGSRLIVDPVSALEDLCSCATPELVGASADSLLLKDPSQRPHIVRMSSRVTAVYREALVTADGICESGTETLFWIRMRRWYPRRQVRIRGVGRVDFLFGERLVIEVDGEEFHTATVEFERDRRRDAVLSALGYRVLRFSYRQVMERWPEVEAAVLAALARGDHG